MESRIIDTLEANEENDLLVPAFLVFFIARLTLILFIHSIFKLKVLTLALVMMLACESAVKGWCAFNSLRDGRYLRHISDIISDFFITEVSVYKRILFYISLYTVVYVLGLFSIVLGIVSSSKILLWGGGLATLISIIKLIPIYPTEGGVNARELAKGASYNSRIVMEYSGFVLLSLIWSLVFDPSLGLIILIPVMLLPFRLDNIKMKFKVFERVEKALLDSIEPLTRKQIYALIYSSPELKSFPTETKLASSSDEEEQQQISSREVVAENLLFEVMMKPMNNNQRKKLSCFLVAVLLFELITSGIVYSYVSDTGVSRLENAMVKGDCESVKKLRDVYAPYILTGKNADFLGEKGSISSCFSGPLTSKKRSVIKNKPKKKKILRNQKNYTQFI